MSASTARITVTRREAGDVKDRQIVVSVDGQPWTTLLFGHQATKPLEPGEHRLRAHNTLFWKTIDVVLQPDEHVRFVVANRAGFGTYPLLGLLGAGPLYLTFEREGGGSAAPDRPISGAVE